MAPRKPERVTEFFIGQIMQIGSAVVRVDCIWDDPYLLVVSQVYPVPRSAVSRILDDRQLLAARELSTRMDGLYRAATKKKTAA